MPKWLNMTAGGVTFVKSGAFSVMDFLQHFDCYVQMTK
jgi:hypothetical protein